MLFKLTASLNFRIKNLLRFQAEQVLLFKYYLLIVANHARY